MAFEAKQDARFAAVDARFAKVDARFEAVEAKLDAINVRFEHLESRIDAQFKAILAAIGQSKAENEAFMLRQIAATSERIAALEATRH